MRVCRVKARGWEVVSTISPPSQAVPIFSIKTNLALILLSGIPNNYKLTLSPSTPAIMISDDQLYQLAIFLGSVSMLLIVLYHFLEVNAENDDKATPLSAERKADTVPGAKPVRS
ncbi:hypothetical protein JADG_010533 [Aureobasidium aubasidani]|nr:hypothetical protein JADG_010533 [Aureobasidium pullulans]